MIQTRIHQLASGYWAFQIKGNSLWVTIFVNTSREWVENRASRLGFKWEKTYAETETKE